MAWQDYLLFENQAVLAVAVAVAVFVISYQVLTLVFGRSKLGIALLISIPIALIVGWQLYQERFYGYEGVLAVIVYLFVAIILVRILLAIVRGSKRTFRR